MVGILYFPRRGNLNLKVSCAIQSLVNSRVRNQTSANHTLKPRQLSDATLPWRIWGGHKASHFAFYLYTESVITIVIPLSLVWTLPNQAHRRSWWNVSTGSPTTRLLTEDKLQRKMNSTKHAERISVVPSHKEVPF